MEVESPKNHNMLNRRMQVYSWQNISKSMDWFLYDIALRHERVKEEKKHISYIIC